MNSPHTALVLLCILWSLMLVNGVRFHPKASRSLPHAVALRSGISPRGVTNIDDALDILYLVNITVAGQEFEVILDTGSSDLWVPGSFEQTSSLADLSITITYGKGSVEGKVTFADVTFASNEVVSQALLHNVVVADTASIGILGLGPSQGSVISSVLKDHTGNTFVEQVFSQNTSSPNFISFILGREAGSSQNNITKFTISEIITGLENVTHQPELSVQILPASEKSGQHWTILVDGIVGPDGTRVNVASTSSDTNSSLASNTTQLRAILDSGFSFPQVPSAITDAFYGRVVGAQFNSSDNVWTIPCNQELNVSFTIGGHNYPIHPLDLTINPHSSQDSGAPNGSCFGTFRPFASGQFGAGFDMILGMAFLRNTYSLFNYGDFESSNTNVTKAPFVQLLSTTDPTVAHQEFVTNRLGGNDYTSSETFALVSDENAQHHLPTSTQTSNQGPGISEETKKILIIVGICVAALLAILVILAAIFALNSRQKRKDKKPRGSFGFSNRRGSYKPLDLPAPEKHLS